MEDAEFSPGYREHQVGAENLSEPDRTQGAPGVFVFHDGPASK